MGEMANNSGGSGGSPATAETAAVRWESILPKMELRVLLVESDDSTRHIITALLKKCSYKVAAVPDGLKAWEALIGNPDSFDLILTEVELPAISGFALLTLIMEHKTCKNIPVIMMSAQDSVTTVYSCMQRGAADFLVKPLRKNELRNLWQHVWRRQAQSSSGGPGPQEESTAQQKIEVTAETNANNFCDLLCIQKNREFIEKGHDAQSSCTKPNLDVGSAEVQCALGLMPGITINNHESYPIADKKGQALNFVAEGSKESTGLTAQDSDSVREVIDLIGAFDNYLKRTRRPSSANVVASNLADPLPELDLTLKRDSSVSVETISEGKSILNHSESSPFSRYVKRPQNPSSSFSQQKDQKSGSDLSIALPEGTEAKVVPSSQHVLLSAPVAVRGGIRLDNKSQLFHAQSGFSAMQGSSSANEYFQLSYPPPPPYGLMVQNPSDMAVDQKEQKVETVSSATDQSANSSFTGIVSSFQNILTVGKEKTDIAPFLPASEYGRGEAFRLHAEGSSVKSLQRAAALEKFRQKRKERCFDKKVRYESRKKLAEKRPRVKGQFVRQAAEESSSPAE